ncbi:MAG: ScyD/ScyE family protein, partial [Thermomicrobiales bacterium]
FRRRRAYGRRGPLATAGPPAFSAGGLTNPTGFTWDAAGVLYVAEADRTGVPAGPAVEPVPGTPDAAAAGAQPTVPGVGTAHAGAQSGSVVKITNGCPATVADGFASATNPDLGWALGVSAVAFLDGQLYALVDGGGAATENPDLPNGVYTVNPDGTSAVVADLSAWLRVNDVSRPHEPLTPDGQPFGMIAGADALWVTESNHGQLLRITPDGAILRVADFSPLGDTVPTGIAAAPDGGWYVGFRSPPPFAPGTSKVMKVAADGTATDVWTGLSTVTGVAVGPDGALYAAELTTGEGSGVTPPFVIPGSGKVVRQTGPAASADVATGLSSPTWLAFGPDGGLYVDGPAIGAYHGEGMILRLDPAATTAVDASMVAPMAACPTDATPTP